MRSWFFAAVGILGLAQAGYAAQPIDCAAPITKAQKAIEKITGDLQGMDKMMAKSEMSQIHSLVGRARRLLKEARQECNHPHGPYDQARAVAGAESANGYATAADILHFHYMEQMSGSMNGMQKGETKPTQQSGAAAMQDMGGMGKKQ